MKKEIDIHIGEFYASREPKIIKTILGSCVAACLYDPVIRIGGMNHILLPGRADLRNYNNTARFAVNAMELLINRIMMLGGDRRNLKAKVFGGAQMFKTVPEGRRIGDSNVAFVLEFLEIEDIEVVSRDIGGSHARVIHFHTDTGDAFLKRSKTLTPPDIDQFEKEAIDRIKKDVNTPGEITLFGK